MKPTPRPLGATDEKIAEWELKLKNQGPPGMSFGPRYEAMAREAFYAGCWLRERLMERDVDPLLRRKSCASLGQISHGRDPWLVARIMLDDFEKATYYEPGLELGDALLRGELSAHFGPGGEGRSKHEMMELLEIGSLQELLDRYGVKTPAELKAKLETEIAKITSAMP